MGIVGENVQAEGIANVKLDGGIGQCGLGGYSVKGGMARMKLGVYWELELQ